jgi:hypothetical protein
LSAQITRVAACSDDTVLFRDDDDERNGILWNVSTVNKPLAHGADVVLDAGPFQLFLFVPLETIKPRLTQSPEQAASDIDEQPPVATSTTPVPPEDGLSDAATEHVLARARSRSRTPAATAPTTATATIARPATIDDP